MPSSKHLEPNRLVLIGSSTGGPGHLHKIVLSLPERFSATVIIAQHIAPEFIPSFVKQLNNDSKIEVEAVIDNMLLAKSKVYVCSAETTINTNAEKLQFTQKKALKPQYNPDINLLFHSAAKLSKQYKCLAIILTGIGDDGSEGIKQMALQGASCIAECETTTIVNGMPLQARLKVKNIMVKPLQDIIKSIKMFGM